MVIIDRTFRSQNSEYKDSEHIQNKDIHHPMKKNSPSCALPFSTYHPGSCSQRSNKITQLITTENPVNTTTNILLIKSKSIKPQTRWQPKVPWLMHWLHATCLPSQLNRVITCLFTAFNWISTIVWEFWEKITQIFVLETRLENRHLSKHWQNH